MNFDEILNEYLDRLRDQKSRGASHDTIRDTFLNFLRTAFPSLQTESFWLEGRIPALRVRGGVADAIYEDTIWEFKRSLDAERDAGVEELHRYLLNQPKPECYLGILTDGETLELYAVADGRLEKQGGISLQKEPADGVKLWLDCLLFHESRRPPTTDDIVARFGEGSPTFRQGLRRIRDAWSKVRTCADVSTKFVEWASLLAIVYGSDVGDEELFLRHTYLALFARILAWAVLTRRAPDASEVKDILTGDAFRQMGFENLVSDDFFTWGLREEVFAEVRTFMQAVAARLMRAYDLTQIDEDLLKELYQEMVDPGTRHDLGEYYTPDWLAERLLREAGWPPKDHDKSSILDPACGSGTFLFAALRLLREEAGIRGKALVDFCIERMAGIDVHPLAVTIARVNLVLALGEDAEKAGKTIALPVYLADTLREPEPNPPLRKDFIRVPVPVEEIERRFRKARSRDVGDSFWIPADLVDRPDILDELVDALVDFSDPDLRYDEASRGFVSKARALSIRWDEEVDMVLKADLRLMRWLRDRPETDTVWRFILKNAYRPEMLAKKRWDYVVGNPPWLAYRYIRNRDYQARVRDLAVERYGLLEAGRRKLFTHIELATVFFAFCADRFLADGGTLAFVMPRSILTGAKQHEKFGEKYVATASVIIDCEDVKPLFNVPACAVVWRKAASAPRRVLRLAGKLPRKNLRFDEAARHLREVVEAAGAARSSAKSPYLDRAFQGASLVPRAFWFVEPDPDARVLDKARPQLTTAEHVFRKAKAPWKVRLRGRVEAEYLGVTILSDDLLPFGWRRLSLVILPPLEPLDTDEQWVREIAALGAVKLKRWMENAVRLWKQHSKTDITLMQRIDWQHTLSAQTPERVFRVIYPAGGAHLCACVVPPKVWEVWGLEVSRFVADTTTYYLEVVDPREAYYLCALLNAPFVDAAIKPMQTRGAFGERHIHRRPFEALPIPEFNPNDSVHMRLAKLSLRCHKKVRRWIQRKDVKSDGPIGRLRSEARKALEEELDEIDRLTKQVLRGAGTSAGPDVRG